MRRFAALFKRNDKSASPTVSSTPNDTKSNRMSKSPSVKKQSRFFRSLSLKAVKPDLIREPPPPVPQPPLQASSFSTSSTDSPTPATPDDDSEFAPNVSHRNSNQWPERRLSLPLPVAGGSLDWDHLRNSSPSFPPIPTVAKPSDSEDLDDGSSATSSLPSVSSPLPVSSRKSLHSLTSNALSPTYSAPPLLYLPNLPLFPRSANSISSIPHQETMASTLSRTQILLRLERRDLTVSEERSIASFTSSRSLPAKPQFILSKLDDGPICDLKRVTNVSQGLKNWVSRPCFEDRMFVYTPGPSGQLDDVIVHSVSGGPFGVAALEVSETIELLAGHTNAEEQSETPWLPTLSVPSTTDLQLSAPASISSPASTPQTRNQPRRAEPSPQRTKTIPPSPDRAKPLKPEQPPLQSSLSSRTPSSASLATRTKRVRSSVRFDVDEKQDKDEHVPLGQIMRIKRGREERAKFLELEKERRALEDERQKHEAEKRKWEQERRAWEAERTAAEEEKKKRLYQQEVIAARKRRESQGFKVGSPLTDSPKVEPQNTRRQPSYSRPVYDTLRRQSLDGSSPPVSHPPSRNDSFNSLRGTSKPQSLHSMPPSRNSSSTASSIEESTRTTGRPTSMLTGTVPQLPMMMQPFGYPWGMPVMPQMPTHVQMVPQMPYHYAMDNMPLLPPTAPFMMQQTHDRRNSRSGSPNRSSSSLRESASQSTEKLPLNQRTSPVRRPAGHQKSSSGGSSNQLGPGQRSNQGSVSSRRSSGIVKDPNQWRNSTRSRPPIPQSVSQRPGSWVVPSPAPQIRQSTIS